MCVQRQRTYPGALQSQKVGEKQGTSRGDREVAREGRKTKRKQVSRSHGKHLRKKPGVKGVQCS